MTSIKVYS